MAGCQQPDGGNGGGTATYTTPANVGPVNGITASVTFNQASPQAAGTSVSATVSLSGTAVAGRLFSVNLSSVINSFNANGSYTGNSNGTDAHLVFQFQNVAFTHNMETSDTNASGYVGSAMKNYLTGDFLTGLEAAGVPESVLWASKRYVANKGNDDATAADLIEDKLWLPTEWEMFGSNTYLDTTHETAANQARLEYYTTDTRRIKYNVSNSANWYFLASPDSGSADNFCNVDTTGGADNIIASACGGVIDSWWEHQKTRRQKSMHRIELSYDEVYHHDG
ncbi:MAG: DUF6273 domain-containing protein [Treponema sp.]|nr:DUF6273 domain-containing protein [Treponema sp.]